MATTVDMAMLLVMVAVVAAVVVAAVGEVAAVAVLAVLAAVAVLALRLLLLLGRMDLFPLAGTGPRQLAPAERVPGQAVPPVPTASRADNADDPAEARPAATLQHLMAGEHAYRSEHLTVAGLAQRLAMPENRQRRLIHQRLGHRNFSAHVNGWRLAEVRAALADPAQRAVPVLTMALDAGLPSIGPFNRAFKAATGQTPTESRRQQLADSRHRPAESRKRLDWPGIGPTRRYPLGILGASGGVGRPIRRSDMDAVVTRGAGKDAWCKQRRSWQTGEQQAGAWARRRVRTAALLCAGLLAGWLVVAGGARAVVGLGEIGASGECGPVTLYWPSSDPAQPVRRGPFTLQLAPQGAALAGNGRRVVISHGSGGGPCVHADLASRLVQAGVGVAVAEHQADNSHDPSRPGPDRWTLRPAEVSAAIGAVAADPRFAPLLWLGRVGVCGLSAGGHTALSLAGGRWSPGLFRRHCEARNQLPAVDGKIAGVFSRPLLP